MASSFPAEPWSPCRNRENSLGRVTTLVTALTQDRQVGRTEGDAASERGRCAYLYSRTEGQQCVNRPPEAKVQSRQPVPRLPHSRQPDHSLPGVHRGHLYSPQWAGSQHLSASVNCNAAQLAGPVLVPRRPGVHTAQEEGLWARPAQAPEPILHPGVREQQPP